MAVVVVKSTALTNADATSKVFTDASIAAGHLIEAYGFATVTSGDSILSAYKMVRLPSNARLSSVKLVTGALNTGCKVDVGLWYPPTIPTGGGAFLAASLAGTLVNSTAVATAIDVSAAVTTWTEQFGTVASTAAAAEAPLWSLFGLSADPECLMDLGYIIRNAAAGTTGVIAMKAQYVF